MTISSRVSAYTTVVAVGALALISGGCAGGSDQTPDARTKAEKKGDETIRSSPVETVPLENPVIRAMELPLGSKTQILNVTGTIYLTRNGKGIKNPAVGSEIQPGDLLQLSANSSVALKDLAGRETTLTDRSGEWYKFTEARP